MDNSSADDDATDEYVSPLTEYPEAHQEIFDRARTEADAVEIYKRHGIDEDSAEFFARILFADGRDHLKALAKDQPQAA